MSKKQILLFCGTALVLIGLVVFGFWVMSRKDGVGEVAGDVVQEIEVSQAELKVFSSKVEVLIPGENDWKEGLDGVKIVAGTRIRTDKTGRAEVRFAGGSVTRIDHNSEIMIEILDTSESNFVINLTKGKIWSRVSKILGKVTYETRTGKTVATVRGTEYGHEIYEGFDRVVVAESKVDVRCVGENPDTLVIDVQVSDWNCDEGSSPKVKESSIDELVLDEWYRFNLEEKSGVGNVTEPIKVLGVVDESSYVPDTTTKPTNTILVDCVGPDGKTAKSTKAECDRLWDYWNDNPPPAAPHVDLGGTSTSATPKPTPIMSSTPTPTPTPTPTATPIPFTLSSANCDSYYGCFTMDVVGSGFASGIRIKVKDANGVMTEGGVQVSDANNAFVDFGSYSLCFSGASPYDVMAFYVDGSFQTVSGFIPGFCSIVN